MIYRDDKLDLLPALSTQPLPRRMVLLAEDAAFMGLSPKGVSVGGGLVHVWLSPPTPDPRSSSSPG